MGARKGHAGGCKVCAHLERGRIELLLASGAGQTAIAAKFGVSKDSVHRHWRDHVDEERRLTLIMGPVQRQALAARVAEENSSVIDHLKAIRAGLYQQYTAALAAGDRTSGSLLAGRLHENLRIVARLTGELAASPLIQQTNIHVNLTQHPDFLELMQDLAEALGPYPEARRAVFARIEQREVAPDDEAEPIPRLEHHDEQPHEAAETAAAT